MHSYILGVTFQDILPTKINVIKELFASKASVPPLESPPQIRHLALFLIDPLVT